MTKYPIKMSLFQISPPGWTRCKHDEKHKQDHLISQSFQSVHNGLQVQYEDIFVLRPEVPPSTWIS